MGTAPLWCSTDLIVKKHLLIAGLNLLLEVVPHLPAQQYHLVLALRWLCHHLALSQATVMHISRCVPQPPALWDPHQPVSVTRPEGNHGGDRKRGRKASSSHHYCQEEQAVVDGTALKG